MLLFGQIACFPSQNESAPYAYDPIDNPPNSVCLEMTIYDLYPNAHSLVVTAHNVQSMPLISSTSKTRSYLHSSIGTLTPSHAAFSLVPCVIMSDTSGYKKTQLLSRDPTMTSLY